jgi:hypothetical protein
MVAVLIVVVKSVGYVGCGNGDCIGVSPLSGGSIESVACGG